MSFSSLTSQQAREILNVSESASQKQIKDSFRKLSLIWHTDKHTQDIKIEQVFATEIFKSINEAYHLLLKDSTNCNSSVNSKTNSRTGETERVILKTSQVEAFLCILSSDLDCVILDKQFCNRCAETKLDCTILQSRPITKQFMNSCRNLIQAYKIKCVCIFLIEN